MIRGLERIMPKSHENESFFPCSSYGSLNCEYGTPSPFNSFVETEVLLKRWRLRLYLEQVTDVS